MEEKEKKLQEMYMNFQMVDQHIKQLQKQLEMVTNQIVELTLTENGLDEFVRVKRGSEIFVPISSGIFAKASIEDTTELLVNVGADVVVKKDVPSAKKLIQKQIEDIKKFQKQMIEELDKMTSYAAQIEGELQEFAGH